MAEVANPEIQILIAVNVPATNRERSVLEGQRLERSRYVRIEIDPRPTRLLATVLRDG